ncbi:unnamed protein product [Thlaspi arvense]|uniref:Uncharacterized protein n=1 Tax=Thlaspi arvense TaxID=13288 RepID=A0AAU9T555_THLAR|nr:unnamed protein product [Thlaspi arvense]
MADRMTRIAIVNNDRCKPKKCRQECKKSCPVVKTGRLCIEVTSTSKTAFLSEELCIGCGICVKKCPFGAIQIVNLPKDLEKDTIHRYRENSFKLHRLPVPRSGQVLGLVGTNGIGKSTALKILANKLKPNLGRYNNPPDWQEILNHFRSSELQSYFTRLLEEDLTVVIKPQHVDQIKKFAQGKIGMTLEKMDERGMMEEICADMELTKILERDVADVSGGELQREGINVFLAGFIPTENLRFRDESLSFKVSDTPQESDGEVKSYARYNYPNMSKTVKDFKLEVMGGEFTDSQIIVMLGENATGKTTFIRMLAGAFPDEKGIPVFNVSYKPQGIDSKSARTVREFLQDKIRDAYVHPQFASDVMRPLQIEELLDQQMCDLYGGEKQRVAITLCLGKPADIYLIDEPSAHLDSQQRITASKVIKRFILHAKKSAFVVEHDFIMATYLADRVIVY